MIIVWYFDLFTACNAFILIKSVVLPLSGSIKTTGLGGLVMLQSAQPLF
jgi:hypothetical protein